VKLNPINNKVASLTASDVTVKLYNALNPRAVDVFNLCLGQIYGSCMSGNSLSQVVERCALPLLQDLEAFIPKCRVLSIINNKVSLEMLVISQNKLKIVNFTIFFSFRTIDSWSCIIDKNAVYVVDENVKKTNILAEKVEGI